jgi:predicted nucleotidyltransferase component of viral defense system
MIPDFAQTLYSRFEQEGVTLLLAGGWAVNFHGYSRFTRDVDWICSRANERKACDLMESLGLTKTAEGMASRFVMSKDPSLPPVDLIWVDEVTFEKMAATENRTGRHGDIPVIGFESLLAMKLHALKDDKHRQGRDVLDIRSLLEYSPTRISEERVKELCLRYAGPGVYESQIEPYR